MVGTVVKRRIKRFIGKYGENFSINGAGSYQGIFQVMTTGQIHSLYIDADAASVTRPAHYAIMDADVSIASGDLVTRDTRSMVVRKVFIYRIANTPIYKLASMD